MQTCPCGGFGETTLPPWGEAIAEPATGTSAAFRTNLRNHFRQRYNTTVEKILGHAQQEISYFSWFFVPFVVTKVEIIFGNGIMPKPKIFEVRHGKKDHISREFRG
jgi:hypothetical protein